MSNLGTLDELLGYSCDELQLSSTRHMNAERAYKAVGSWLADPASELNRYDPYIYPQGSFKIGTTIHPISRNEYDLDFVFELRKFPNPSPDDAVKILNAVERRLRDHATYKTMIEPKKRCVRLVYADEFHMDILPAIPDRSQIGGTHVHVPDRDLENWKPSNPKGYAQWFDGRGALYKSSLSQKKIDVLPEQEDADEKTPLQRVVQLMKRARDRYYSTHRDPDSAPRSIVLTTLAGHAYSGTASTAQALQEILHHIKVNPTMEVRNPANTKEVLSEQWQKDHQAFYEFHKWIDWFSEKWNAALNSHSATELAKNLSELFGEEPVRGAYKKQVARLEGLRNAGSLGITRSGALTSAASASVIVPKNTFYGR